jgi:type I restriction enzyme S subunit
VSVILKRYPEYKKSALPWLGKVPAHWLTIPAFVAFRERQELNKDLREKQVLSLSYGRIIKKHEDALHGLVPASFETYQIVEPGNIILRLTDLQNDQRSLRVGLAKHRGIITSAYVCLAVRGRLLAEFAYYLLHAADVQKVFYGMGSGLRQSLGFRDLRRLTVAFPDEDEQKTITHFLDTSEKRIEKLVKAKRRLIELLNEQKQVIIYRAVTRGLSTNARLKPSRVESLGDVPEHWQVLPLASVADVIDPNPSHRNPTYVDNGFPFISTVEFTGTDSIVLDTPRRVAESTVVEQELRCGFREGSIAFSRKGTIGAARILPSGVRFALLDSVCVINCNEDVNYNFLYRQLSSPAIAGQFGALVRGAALKQVSVGRVRGLRVVVPPLEEQAAIAQYIDGHIVGLDRAVLAIKRDIGLLREYRPRLIADVVTGKLDVRGVDLSVLDETEKSDLLTDVAEDGPNGAEELVPAGEVPDAD